ncbi:unnamed protein product, partial [Meganyctiphanes norvegica]
IQSTSDILAQHQSPTRVKVGSYNAKQSFSGKISQVNIWNRILRKEEIESISSCQFESLEGNIVKWSEQWTTHGDVQKQNIPLTELCTKQQEQDLFLFHDITFNVAAYICHGLGGRVPYAESREDYDTLYKNLNDKFTSLHSNNTKLWGGIVDREQEGVWKEAKNGTQVSPFWQPYEPNGNLFQNCGQFSVKGMADVPCHSLNVAACVVPGRPVWRLLGTCRDSTASGPYKFRPVQTDPDIIEFHGYGRFKILKNDSDTWIWLDWRQKITIASLLWPRYDMPFGRQQWRIEIPYCEQDAGTPRELLLTSCSNSSFTCNDGTCIPLRHRCDLENHCQDKSDETGCRIIRFPSGYRKALPPPGPISNTPLPVLVHIIIDKIDVETASATISSSFNLTMVWNDVDLQFVNLNDDYTLNQVSLPDLHKLWIPWIEFINTEGNHITILDEQAYMKINKNSSYTEADITSSYETELYSGSTNPFHLSRKYGKKFQCNFHLSSYPFDKQVCYMKMAMLPASTKQIIFHSNESSVSFVGSLELMEYMITNIDIIVDNDVNDLAHVYVKVGLSRLSGFIFLTVYIPSGLMLVISYLTLYFNVAIFQVRALAAITALLVTSTIFTQASASLPKASYVKFLDIWLMFCIILLVTVVMFHTLIDHFYNKTSRTISVSPLEGQKIMKNNRSIYINLVLISRIGIPLIFFIFNIIYWSLAISF